MALLVLDVALEELGAEGIISGQLHPRPPDGEVVRRQRSAAGDLFARRRRRAPRRRSSTARRNSARACSWSVLRLPFQVGSTSGRSGSSPSRTHRTRARRGAVPTRRRGSSVKASSGNSGAGGADHPPLLVEPQDGGNVGQAVGIGEPALRVDEHGVLDALDERGDVVDESRRWPPRPRRTGARRARRGPPAIRAGRPGSRTSWRRRPPGSCPGSARTTGGSRRPGPSGRGRGRSPIRASTPESTRFPITAMRWVWSTA